ncbi:MAG: futalosine hydrolase [Geobacteraceae bacterium]|nr:futalosine hydrolase [Geobacteraceae bacterium]
MKPVIVTAATHRELSLLIRALEGGGRLHLQGREGYRGELAGWPAILAVTGIGKVNTAAAVTSLLERFEPELLINTGCAGAYRGSGLAVGDLAMATAELFGDEGVLAPDGWHSLELIGIPALERNGERWFNAFPLTRWALDKASHVADGAGLALRRGPFITVSTASGTAERGDELLRRFGGICENMEGGAAAQVALLYGADCLELRGVSNLVEDRDLSRWDIPLAAERAQAFIMRFIGALCRAE